MKTLLQSIRMLVVLTVLTGFVYPLAVTLCSHIAFPFQSNGSLLTRDGQVAGSALLAQKFDQPQYFWPRPSAADYATVASGAGNKGPTSVDLAKSIADRRTQVGQDAPVDFLTASASGLDPDISPAAAQFQASRVATARHLTPGQVNGFIVNATQAPQLGLLGEPRVNVLALNRALDGIK